MDDGKKGTVIAKVTMLIQAEPVSRSARIIDLSKEKVFGCTSRFEKRRRSLTLYTLADYDNENTVHEKGHQRRFERSIRVISPHFLCSRWATWSKIPHHRASMGLHGSSLLSPFSAILSACFPCSIEKIDKRPMRLCSMHVA